MAWFIVILWAVGLVAFLVYFFRHFYGLRGFLLSVLGLIALVISVVLQASLTDYSGYNSFVEAASRLGYALLIFAVTVFAAAMIAGIIYTLRHGQSDHRKGKVITENRPLTPMSLAYPALMGRSKRKILSSKNHFVTMESLVDGTATFAERLVVLDIIIIFIAFFLIWLGLGLMLMKNILILGLMPVLPCLWVYANLRDDWEQYRAAKQKVAARSGD